MARSRIPQDLVHDPVLVEKEGQILDRLVATAAEFAEPVVRRALEREASMAVARQWADQAAAVFGELADDAALTAADQDVFAQELANGLILGATKPDRHEVRAVTAQLSRALMKGWIQTLHDRSEQVSELAFTDLLPLGAKDADYWLPLWQSIDAFPTSRQEDLNILRSACERLLDHGNGEWMPLPLGLSLHRPALKMAVQFTSVPAVARMEEMVPMMVREMGRLAIESKEGHVLLSEPIGEPRAFTGVAIQILASCFEDGARSARAILKKSLDKHASLPAAAKPDPLKSFSN